LKDNAGAIIIANEANAAAAITEAAVDADGDAAVIEAAVRLLLLLEISEAVLPACKAAIGTSSVVAQTNGFAVLELYCRDCSPDKIDNCIELDIAPQLAALIVVANESALKLIGNLVAGEEHHVDVLVEAGVIDALAAVLTSNRAQSAPSTFVESSACFALSNVAAGTDEHTAAVINCAGLIASVTNVLAISNSSKSKEEALHALLALAESEDETGMNLLIEANLVQVLCNEETMSEISLETLKALLDWGATKTLDPVLPLLKDCNGLDAVRKAVSGEHGELAEEIIDLCAE
jgi:hypothetical protein